MNVYVKLAEADTIRNRPHFFFFKGKQKDYGSWINFPCSSAYLIHDVKDLHYQVEFFLYDTIAAVSFIYTPSLHTVLAFLRIFEQHWS